METYQCEKCNCDIKFGTSYYAIVRSLEFQTFDSETKEEVVEVEEAEEIIRLCKTCGSQFNHNALDIIIRHLPIAGQETNN